MSFPHLPSSPLLCRSHAAGSRAHHWHQILSLGHLATTFKDRLFYTGIAQATEFKDLPLETCADIFNHVARWAAEDAARLCPATGAGPPPTSEEYRSAYVALESDLIAIVKVVGSFGSGFGKGSCPIYPALSAAGRAAWDRLCTEFCPRLPPSLRAVLHSPMWAAHLPSTDSGSGHLRRITDECTAMLRDEALWMNIGTKPNMWMGSSMAVQLRIFSHLHLESWISHFRDERLARRYRHVIIKELLDKWDPARREFTREGAAEVRGAWRRPHLRAAALIVQHSFYLLQRSWRHIFILLLYVLFFFLSTSRCSRTSCPFTTSS
jgi:hypothetical protein